MSGNEILKTFSGENHVVKVDKSGEKKEVYVAFHIHEFVSKMTLIIAIPDGKGKHVVESLFLGYTDVIHAIKTYVRPYYVIREVIYDQWTTSQLIVSELEKYPFRTIPYNESTRMMSPCINELLNLIKENKILHTGHPELQKQINLTEIKEDANGNVNYAKNESGNIGAVIALTMAVSRSIRHKEGRHKPEPKKLQGAERLGIEIQNASYLTKIMYSEENIAMMTEIIQDRIAKGLQRANRAKGFK